jgi:hypothetical protein
VGTKFLSELLRAAFENNTPTSAVNEIITYIEQRTLKINQERVKWLGLFRKYSDDEGLLLEGDREEVLRAVYRSGNYFSALYTIMHEGNRDKLREVLHWIAEEDDMEEVLRRALITFNRVDIYPGSEEEATLLEVLRFMGKNPNDLYGRSVIIDKWLDKINDV